MLNLNVNMPKELLPFAWLNGKWVGYGVKYGENSETKDILVEIFFEIESCNNEYENNSWMRQTTHLYNVDEEKSPKVAPETSGKQGYEKLSLKNMIQSQTAYWYLGKEKTPTNKNTKSFELQVINLTTQGRAGSWYGYIDGPVIQIATDGILATKNAPKHGGERQLYGLVDSDLMMVAEKIDEDKNMNPIFSIRMSKVVE